MSALIVKEITARFGGVIAVDRVTLEIATGERRGLIGPNGAGKTTLFNLIGGQTTAARGIVQLFGEDVTKLAPRARAHRSIARTFQTSRLFPQLTLRENVMLSVQAFQRERYCMYRTAYSLRCLQRIVDELLQMWKLTDKAQKPVRFLSYGDQRQLEIVMAVANKPKLLLLDEPTAGLSSAETALVTELICGLSRDVTVLFIEHDMDVAFKIADRITVLNQGRIVAEGTPAEIRSNRSIHEIYFGKFVDAL